MPGFPQENQWDCGKEAITCKCSALRESQDGRREQINLIQIQKKKQIQIHTKKEIQIQI